MKKPWSVPRAGWISWGGL